jgi:chemotaxis protein methyltransferase CheR
MPPDSARASRLRREISLPDTPALQPDEFTWICRFLYQRTGILLGDGKQAMVVSRLEKRLRKLGLQSYFAYFQLFDKVGQELETETAIDLLTTNETYFFREEKHFEFFRLQVLPRHAKGQPLLVWSAASSSGEEAYTLAMLLAEWRPDGQWGVMGSDISRRMLDKATQGLYPLTAAKHIPRPMLKKYCLRGRDEYADFLLIDAALRQRVNFQYINLMQPLPELGLFDVILLRNVMIYFDLPTKQQVIERLQTRLRPGGHFIIGHSESLNGLKHTLQLVSPSIYQLAAKS